MMGAISHLGNNLLFEQDLILLRRIITSFYNATFTLQTNTGKLHLPMKMYFHIIIYQSVIFHYPCPPKKPHHAF